MIVNYNFNIIDYFDSDLSQNSLGFKNTYQYLFTKCQ